MLWRWRTQICWFEDIEPFQAVHCWYETHGLWMWYGYGARSTYFLLVFSRTHRHMEKTRLPAMGRLMSTLFWTGDLRLCSCVCSRRKQRNMFTWYLPPECTRRLWFSVFHVWLCLFNMSPLLLWRVYFNLFCPEVSVWRLCSPWEKLHLLSLCPVYKVYYFLSVIE